MSPSKSTRSESGENITISTKPTTVSTSPSPFVSKYFLESRPEMFARSDERSNKYYQRFEKQEEQLKHLRGKQHEELVYLKSETLCLSEDTQVIKETIKKLMGYRIFYGKMILYD